MDFSTKKTALALLVGLALAGNAYASDAKHEPPKDANKCIGAGPQAPRDIDKSAGSNSVMFEEAPAIEAMNLCNVHFHRNAEHKAAAYSTYVEDGKVRSGP